MITNGKILRKPFFNWNTDIGTFTIDASVGAGTSAVTYEWYENGELISTNPAMIFVGGDHTCIDDSPNSVGGNPIFTVVIRDIKSECVYTQSFITKGVCDKSSSLSGTTSIAGKESAPRPSLKTMVYPNPSEPQRTFTYEVFASETFSGDVKVYTVSGVLLNEVKLEGASRYNLPFSLDTAGVYLIRTTSTLGIVKTDRVIIK